MGHSFEENSQIQDKDLESTLITGEPHLIEKLENLWGQKLSYDKSKEAYTPNWIFAALTDFKRRL
ncbi:MAG: hypothetical protein RID09_25295 [Coleofasciculus sp. G1-WW12-02]